VREQFLEPADIVDGVKVANAMQVAELIQQAETTIIF
jgi:predicted peroxiredoxin